MSVCKVCDNPTGNKSHIAREMMFGSRDEFDYLECAKCGCLQIGKIPEDLSRYYPENYYAFHRSCETKEGRVKSFFKHQRACYCLYGKNPLGMLLSKVFGAPVYYEWLRGAAVHFQSEILDVGCGDGHFLLGMQKDGFSSLTGVDAFIDDHICYEDGVRILKKEISDVDQNFDFIMLRHSFEHMSRPRGVFQELYRLLRPNRYLLISTPVSSSFAWRTYSVNWVQLDAPRHLFLHTPASIKILADEVGFEVADVIFDSTEFQFWGSEQYMRGIPLRDSNSYAENPQQSVFSKDKIESFKTQALDLNKINDGDSARFYLYKP